MKMSRAVLLAFQVLDVLTISLEGFAHAGSISNSCISGSASRWTAVAHGNANGNYLIIWSDYSDTNMKVWDIFVFNNPNYPSTDDSPLCDYGPNGIIPRLAKTSCQPLSQCDGDGITHSRRSQMERSDVVRCLGKSSCY